MADSADSKRKSERIPFDRALKVKKPALVEGKGVDIAAGGIGVDVAQPIAEGVTVELEYFDDGAVFAGTVRMVRSLDGGGFRLGIQFNQEDASLIARARALRASAG